jgi:ketosteroid isomerase-like protein
VQRLVAIGPGHEHEPVPFDVQRLLRLWTDPLPADDEGASAAFRELYTDPVTVNGLSLTAADLVARARVMQQALERPECEVLSVVDAGASVAVAFRLTGRQVGPLDTPAGRVPPTGERLDLRIIDILTLSDGRISGIWMVADWLTPLAAAGAVQVSGHERTP